MFFAYCFSRDIHEGHLPLKEADEEQSNLGKRQMEITKKFFLTNLELLFSARENVLNKLGSRLFPTKKLDKIPTRELTPELATEPTKHKKSKLKLQQELMDEIMADKKDKNDEIFWNYFKYQNPTLLEKDLIRATQAKNEQLINNVNSVLINLRNDIIRKKYWKWKSKQTVNIVEKSLDFKKQKMKTELKY